MEALVFAAGRGARLRPYTDETPKPLLDVASESILSQCLRAIVDAGIDRLTIVVGYWADAVVDAVVDEFAGRPVTYVLQAEPKGLAHAVLAAESRVEGDVLTVNGDNVFDCDLSPLVARHRDPGVDGTLLLDRVSRNEAETTALCDRAPDGTIREVESSSTETPETGFIAAGAQTHDGPALLEACRAVDRAASGEYELADALQRLVDRGRRYVGVELDGWHLNVNTPADPERAGTLRERSVPGGRCWSVASLAPDVPDVTARGDREHSEVAPERLADMDGLVFAAGEGTRLRPITNETPKPLLEVGGKPILGRCLDELVDLGAERLIVVVGYRGSDVVDRIGDAFRGVPVEYACQREREGMAHAALAAAELVDGDIMLMDGDALFDCDLSPLVARHRESGVDGTLLFERVSPEAARSKAVLKLDADGTIRRIENKPDDPPKRAPVAAGFQTATPALFDACRRVERSPRGEYELAAAIERAIDEGERIVGAECEGWYANVNTPADLEAAREHFS